MELNKYPILGFSAKISAIMKQVKHNTNDQTILLASIVISKLYEMII